MRELPTSLRSPHRDMKRIMLTTDTVGGVWQFTLELAAGLQRLGLEPIIAALGEPPLDGAAIGHVPVFFFPCRLEWMQDPWEDVRRSGRWLLELADHLKADLVHLGGYAHAACDFQVPVLVTGHSCIYSWYQAVKGRTPSARWQPYREAVAGGLAAADAVTAPTAAMLSALLQHYGPFRQAAPIANGRRSADFPVADKAPYIFSAGRLWDDAKNIAVLAQAAGGLGWPVVVAGEDQHPEGGRVLYDNVRLLGFLKQPQYAAWLSKAAVYALPALYEPFGLTVLEAGLAGCALVLGDIPSLRENWNGAALFVPPRRTDLLRAQLNRLIDDPALRRRYARKARQRALAFSAGKMAWDYAELYARLLGQENVLKSPA